MASRQAQGTACHQRTALWRCGVTGPQPARVISGMARRISAMIAAFEQNHPSSNSEEAFEAWAAGR